MGRPNEEIPDYCARCADCARCNVPAKELTLVLGRWICDACYRRIDPCEKEHIALHEEQLEAWKTKLDEVIESKRIIVGELDDARALLREITEENTELRSQLVQQAKKCSPTES